MQNLARSGQVQSQPKRGAAEGGNDDRLDGAASLFRIHLGQEPARLDPAVAWQKSPPERMDGRLGNRLSLADLIDIAELDSQPTVEGCRVAHDFAPSARNQPTNQAGRSPSSPSLTTLGSLIQIERPSTLTAPARLVAEGSATKVNRSPLPKTQRTVSRSPAVS